MLKHATPNQANEIYAHFRQNKTWFPHVRKDYIERMVAAGTVVYEDGIIITYKRYKRRNRIGTAVANKGDVMLHQILNTKEGSGKAGEVLQKFFEMVDCPVWLSVRADNSRAAAFYLKHGMEQMGTTSWMKGAMPGLVFCYSPYEARQKVLDELTQQAQDLKMGY